MRTIILNPATTIPHFIQDCLFIVGGSEKNDKVNSIYGFKSGWSNSQKCLASDMSRLLEFDKTLFQCFEIRGINNSKVFLPFSFVKFRCFKLFKLGDND